MAYTDPQYQSRGQQRVVASPNNPVALSTATATASATQTITGAFTLPKFIRTASISNIRVYVGTAPGGGVTGLTFNFLNGTSTIGSVVVGTLTAGQTADATMGSVTVSSNGVSTAPQWITTTGVQPTVNCTYTATASASTLGSYAVDWEVDELFTT